jgi:fructosamine-3-kinase
MDIANLYPLLAHLNLFGGGYAAQIMTILRKRI